MLHEKIGVIGTHSVGKTTLTEEFSRTYGIPFIRGDRARDIAGVGERLDELSPEDQWRLQQKFLALTEDVVSHQGLLITDCCSLTCDPYSRKLLGDYVANIPDYEDFISRAHNGIKPLTHLCYLPPEIDLVDDGFRPKSPELRMELDVALRDQLSSYPFWVLTGGVERRVEQLAHIVGLPHESMWQRYVAFEGLPSSGKSTQINILRKHLEAQGVSHHVCERFGSETLKREIKSLYQFPLANSQRLLELHLESFREQYVRNEVRSRLESGQLVIADRQKFTILALHMAFGRDVGELYHLTRDLPTPGRVFYFDCLPEVSVGRSLRSGKAESPFKCDKPFQYRVRDAYAWLSAHHHEFVTVNANLPVSVVQEVLRQSFGAAHPFAAATKQVLEIFHAYPQQGTKPWDKQVAARDLAYQVGTLNRSLMQLEGFVHAHGMTVQEIEKAIKLDIGDILTLALFLAHELGIDPYEALCVQFADDLRKIRERR